MKYVLARAAITKYHRLGPIGLDVYPSIHLSSYSEALLRKGSSWGGGINMPDCSQKLHHPDPGLHLAPSPLTGRPSSAWGQDAWGSSHLTSSTCPNCHGQLQAQAPISDWLWLFCLYLFVCFSKMSSVLTGSELTFPICPNSYPNFLDLIFLSFSEKNRNI